MSEWLDSDLSFLLYPLHGQGRNTRLPLQKLEAKELAEQARREKAASAQGVSVWNQACACPIKEMRCGT